MGKLRSVKSGFSSLSLFQARTEEYWCSDDALLPKINVKVIRKDAWD